MPIEQWLEAIPPAAICAMVALVVGLESMGVPLPGETTLITATLLAVQGVVDPVEVAACGAAGAIIGDSVGYAIGRRGGRPLLNRLGRRFPRHFGPSQVAPAERYFERYGMATVFVGRFIALLRILAGPLAGALRMPYPKFLLANAAGGICWAAGMTSIVYFVGTAAKGYLHEFSWLMLVVALVGGLAVSYFVHRRAVRRAAPANQGPDSGETMEAADTPETPHDPVHETAHEDQRRLS